MFNGFAGKNSKKAHPYDFLPFPELFKKDKPQVSYKTAAIVQKLIKEKKLNPRTIALINPVIQDIYGDRVK